MGSRQLLVEALCECRDAHQIAALINNANVQSEVFRDLAAALANDVVHLASNVAASLAIELARAGCSPGVRRIVRESLEHACKSASTDASRFACIAARISLFGRHEGPFLVAAVSAAAEAAMLSARSYGTSEAIRRHQADVARAFLTSMPISRRQRSQHVA